MAKSTPPCPDRNLDPLGWEVWQIQHNAKSVVMAPGTLRAAGGILIDGRQVADTLQCKHCGAHWVPIQGSGRQRGWCHYCEGPLCGKAQCFQCVPAEQALEDLEVGRASVPRLNKRLY